MRDPVLRWLPGILAVGGLTIALVGLAVGSIRVFNSPKSATGATFTVEVFGITMHQRDVDRSEPEQARTRERRRGEADFQSNAKLWLAVIVVGFGAVFGIIGWVVAKLLGRGSADSRSSPPAA